MKPVRLGVVGYSSPERYDKQLALRQLKEAFDRVASDFPARQIIIVSGATDRGIPSQAYRLAAERGYGTGGVACRKANGFKLYPTDEEPIIVGDNWGEESPVFVYGTDAIDNVEPESAGRYADHPHHGLDAMIRIGGGSQALRETRMLKELGKPAYEYDLPHEKRD